MSVGRPSASRPRTEKRLGQLVSDYAEASGLGVRRLRQRVSAMVFVGALQRVAEEDSPARLLIKGGMACELRFRDRARTTRDLDAIFRGSLPDLFADLDAAFAEPYSGFSFIYAEPEPIGEVGAHRFEIKLRYEGRGWGSLRVEVSPPEGPAHEPERLPALSVSEFGLAGPAEVHCLSLRYQIAQKIHACTERFEDRENERVHDLIDLQLMRELIEDLGGVEQACKEIFALRKTHPWPPTLIVEPGWHAPYSALAAELEFPVTDVEQAAVRVQELIDAIRAAVLPTPKD